MNAANRERTVAMRQAASPISEDDVFLFHEGTHFRLDRKLGAHPARIDGRDGVHFAVWAPNAERVSVIGDFNAWDKQSLALARRGDSGVWEGFVEGAELGERYKFHVAGRNGYAADKADPFALRSELPPGRASIVAEPRFEWSDGEWMSARAKRNALASPISIYEVHLGSWRRDANGKWLGYREIAPLLARHVRELGFTHVELLPVMEHPFYGSWGYQTTSYFAPSARYGAPQDLMFLVDHLHAHGIGVFFDWVPSHFPDDEHGLVYFDGTHLYEPADPKRARQPDWGTLTFDYGSREVQSFLISSAFSWLERYHADGLRVDAVASMLLLDFARAPGEWTPNRFGERGNLEAAEFLRRLNAAVYASFEGVQMIAEDSSDWSGVTRPAHSGGLGFGLKWDLGWMHDTLEYLALDPIARRHHHDMLQFRALYAFNENYVLPLSHDEVVYGKRSLAEHVHGDQQQKLATLRLLFGWMWATPGKKLLFMGGELAAKNEWWHEGELEWELAKDPAHAGVARWIADLNREYRSRAALHEFDCDPRGFEWIDANDADESVAIFLRHGADRERPILCAFNFTPVARDRRRAGVPFGGTWREILNSDAREYGGSGEGNLGRVEAEDLPALGREHSLVLNLPPSSAVFFEREEPLP